MKNQLVTPLLTLALVSCASAQVKPFASFEAEAEIQGARLNHSKAALVEKGATDGKKALSITFSPPASYPSYNFPITTALDWSGYGALAFEVTNPGNEPLSFAFRIDTARGSDGSKNSRTNSGRVNAGQTITYLMPFNVEMESPDMSKLAGYTMMRDTTGGWNPFNLKNVVAMQIFTVKPANDSTLIFDNLRLVPALPPVPAPPLRTDTRPLLSFETEAEAQNVKPTSASSSVVTNGATEGKRALQLKFDPPATYPNVGFPFATPQDFRGYGGLAFDLKNPTEESIKFFVRVDSTTSAGGSGEGSRSGSGSLEAGQSGSFVLPFGMNPSMLGMKSLPGFGDFRNLGSSGRGKFDLQNISTWQIFLVRPASSQQLIVDNVRLVPGQKEDFNGMIDQYGQFTRTDWVGKIKSNADFAAQIAKEDADLKANPAPDQFNKYGGWAKGPQLKATGFFRVEKYNGKWTFVDPEGRLFLSFGPDTITVNQSTPIAGREYMFVTSPQNDPTHSKYLNDKHDLDVLGANLERKYGADYKQAFYNRTYDRLRSWGFNTIGAFSSWDTIQNGKVPYTMTLWPGGQHSKIQNGDGSLSDPYDPRFASGFASAAKFAVRNAITDPYCLGYFVGNEEKWGHYRNGFASHYGIIINALKLKADVSPAKRAFLTQLQTKYTEIGRLNAAWGTNFTDWNAMNESVTVKEPFPAPMVEDFSLLLKEFAAQYFRTIQTELKKIDPNHLYLGGRFAGYSPEVLDANLKYTDVMSFNIYRISIDPKEWTILDKYDHPVLIGEFHFGATDRGMFDTGLVGVADQAARGRAYQNYIRSIVDHPKFVGAHWFQYTDQPTIGRGDGENGNVGFVSITDTPYPEIINAARQVHKEIYTRRFGKQ
jgi:hypothetical protein